MTFDRARESSGRVVRPAPIQALPHFTTEWMRSDATLAHRLCEAFEPAPHPLAPPVHGAALRLDALADLLDFDARDAPAPIAGWAPPRRLAFIAGRLCAEQVLARIGFQAAAVGRDVDGAPFWPAGVVGSITHTENAAYAAVAPARDAFGIGIDSQPRVADDAMRAIERLCCTERERQLWGCADDACLLATLLFSSKETLFKAIYRVVGRFVDFDEVEASDVNWTAQRVNVQAVPGGRLADVLPVTVVRFCVRDSVVHTYARPIGRERPVGQS